MCLPKTKQMEEKQEIREMTEAEEMADVFDNPEPWSTAETKLVAYSFAAALIALVIFGILINKYIL